MRNLNVIAAIILFAFFALTSCQKESMADLHSDTLTATTNNERGLPKNGIHIVNEDVHTQATAQSIQQQATSRSRTITPIDCGTAYDGCTIGQGNSIQGNMYPSCISDLGADFKGEDQIFYLVVPETPEAIVTYEISLTGMTVDMDLFLLALDRNGYISECKAISINSYNKEEMITVSGLTPGAYAVIVDGYMAGMVGHFTLTVNCSAVSANPPSIGNNVSHLTAIEIGEKDEFGASLLGSFNKRDATTWKEYGTLLPHFPLDSDMNPARFVFEEVAQDEWSIYLRDDSRGVNIQLDLHRNKVVYSDDNGNAFDLYDILSAY